MTEPAEQPAAAPEYELLEVSQTPDGPRVETSPLPEYIGVSAELWDQVEVYDPHIDADTGIAPPPMWLEEIGHADPDVSNDGWMLHIDAVNVTCIYQLLSEQPDGTRVCLLRSWGEK
jgi:hypothetical protein